MTIEFEQRQQAEEAYILEGRSLEQVAESTGLPVGTIKRWSSEDGWVDMRRDYRRAQGEIRRQTTLYRLALLKKGIESLDPQAAYAWATVEQAAVKSRIGEAGRGGIGEAEKRGIGETAREIRTPEDAVNALQEAITRRLNGLLSSPDAVNLKAVRELKDAMSMVEDLKTKYKAEDRQKGLSEETIRTIEKEVLGIGR